MRFSAHLLFTHSVSQIRFHASPLWQRAALQSLPLHIYRFPLCRARAISTCMSSEPSGDAPPSRCDTPTYGSSDLEHAHHSAPPPSSSEIDSDASPSTSAATEPIDSRLVAAGGFLVTCLVLGSVAAATGFVSPDALLYIARWFEQLGPNAIYLYGVLYFVLELIAVPALPLTLGSGYLFGLLDGTITVSIASTVAATVSFLIARYGLRASVSRIAERNTRFRVFDRAIGREGLKFVLLLRLSPLFPFAISNYLYGLTSVRLGDYMLGSWLGMLPGTIAYVSAGAAVNALTDLHDGQGSMNPWLVVTGLIATIAVLTSIGNIAREAIESVEDEEIPQHH